MAKQEFFVITRISRDDFEAAGYDASELSNEKMTHIANKMGEVYVSVGLFWDSIESWGEELELPQIEQND